jgi:hypothetical protein
LNRIYTCQQQISCNKKVHRIRHIHCPHVLVWHIVSVYTILHTIIISTYDGWFGLFWSNISLSDYTYLSLSSCALRLWDRFTESVAKSSETTKDFCLSLLWGSGWDVKPWIVTLFYYSSSATWNNYFICAIAKYSWNHLQTNRCCLQRFFNSFLVQ